MSKTDFVLFTFLQYIHICMDFNLRIFFTMDVLSIFFQDNVSKRIVRIIVATKAQLHKWLLFL